MDDIQTEAEKIFLYADVIAQYIENKNDFRNILQKGLDDLINNPTITEDKKSTMIANKKILELWELKTKQ